MTQPRVSRTRRSYWILLIKGLGIALVAAAAAGFCLLLASLFMHGAFGPCISSRVELPNEPVFVAVDVQGRLFVYSQHYQRMQVYSPEGRFLIGWFMRPNGIVRGFDSADASVLVVFPDDLEVAYSVNGQILRQVHQPGLYSSTPIPAGFFICAEGIGCSRYRVAHRILWSRVFRTDIDGEHLIVGQPLPIAVIRLPIPCLLWAVLGMVLIRYASPPKRAPRHNGAQPESMDR